MTIKKVLLLFTVALLAGVTAQGTERNVLLPVVVAEALPGAHGSLWTSVLSITNPSSAPVEIMGLGERCRTICPPFTVQPGATAYPGFKSFFASARPVVLPLSGEGADEAVLHLRIQDLSRQSQTWGTEIPVVDVDDTLTGRAHIVDLPPPNEEFRTTLRIVNVDSLPAMMVRIAVYEAGESTAADLLVSETVVDVITTPGEQMTGLPGFIALSLGDLGVSPEGGPYRVSLQPIDPTVRYWAFASITNNETQHVTISTPARR